jgi:hypothetical protein
VSILVACGDHSSGFADDDAGEPFDATQGPDQLVPAFSDAASDSSAPDVDAGPTKRIVFLSSMTFDGELGGAAGADGKCQALAADAGLSGQYMAWISTSTSSADQRFLHSTVPYVLPTGQIVAYSFANLVGGEMAHPINVDEHLMIYDGGCVAGYEPCGWTAVWTETKADGTYDEAGAAASCLGFANDDASTGHVGSYLSTDSTWTAGTGVGAPPLCDNTFPLYCFQQ